MIRAEKEIFAFLIGKKFLLSFLIAFFFLPMTSCLCFSADSAESPKKPLVVYFSESGNTRKIAQEIHRQVGGDILEIKTVKPYPSDYNALTEYAKKELQAGSKPELSTPIPDLNEYSVVFIGYPNWWSSVPMPVHTFADKSKLDGKTVIPFCTHGGGGLGHTEKDLKEMLPHSKILKSFSVHGTKAGSVEKDIKAWLEGLGPALIMTTTGNPAIYPDGAY